MILTDKISKKTISFIRNTLSTSEEDLEIIDYGIKVIVSNFFKIVILFVTAYLLGIFKYTLLALCSFAFLRTFACGVHANSTFQCIIMNFILFIGNVYTSIFHPLNNKLLFLFFLISIIILMLYAPADTAERPLISKSLRKSLKIISLISAIILFIICHFINNSICQTIIIYSMLLESLSVMPLFYKLLGKSYRNYSKITL
ncbi:accessory gene regulator B [Clostridium sp. DSM 8431]|uniref:accessory gene regulator B family protein n=1 Tax=Clostridium sp. DSM 8431 TaxID=1761781 RepID=UPI0008E8BCC7|nr:accessory gene regulator B family protein [Clostridium sp. DSM 8431]SFU60611.1 accessory gene regulator B [Clostridium sp. DSM 8431]